MDFLGSERTSGMTDSPEPISIKPEEDTEVEADMKFPAPLCVVNLETQSHSFTDEDFSGKQKLN